MTQYKISYGEHEDYAKAYMESKGWISVIEIEVEGITYSLNFYDPVRLAQTIKGDIKNGRNYFSEPNLIVIENLAEENIRQAIEKLIADGQLSNFVTKDM